jgi:hypothetical protein
MGEGPVVRGKRRVFVHRRRTLGLDLNFLLATATADTPWAALGGHGNTPSVARRRSREREDPRYDPWFPLVKDAW